ncbi:recombinase family protein [Mycobacterium ahvazicum]|uniref:recombinase family protein n=1 Tax=Mycobacterium ahvazicum TaxID=1964395 RepID=UPI000BB913A4
MSAKRRRGRPRLCSDRLLLHVVAMRNEGLTYQSICDVLNEEGVPTPAGGSRWWRSHVSRLLHTRSAQELTYASVSGSLAD